MKNINLPMLHSKIENFIQERDWDQFHSVKNLTMALSVETSELVEIFQWMKEPDSNEAHLDSLLRDKIQDELADIFFFLLRLSAKNKVDLEEALLRKLEKNAEKYPADKVRGSSKKYDQY